MDQPEILAAWEIMAEPLPEDTKRFLEVNIDSLDQLEILRVLGEDPQKEWRAANLAREAQAAPQTIGTHLTVLQARGLLTLQTRDAELFCRYGAANSELAERLARLLQVYRERPVTIIKLIYASARDPLRSFADAFRLKEEK